MTIEELASYSCVKVKTIEKNIHKINGVIKNENNLWVIPDGSRYPYDAHRYKFDTLEKRRKVLLEATYHLRYIDNKILNISEELFNFIINELVNEGYLSKNNSNNKYGANQYNTTVKYDLIRKKLRRELINSISSTAGNMVGLCANAVN